VTSNRSWLCISRKKETRFPTRKQQQELHKPATILLRTSGNLMRAFGLQKVFIHSSILYSFPILYFILQNRFHPSYVILLNFRLFINHPTILFSPTSFLHSLLSVASSTAPCCHYRYWSFTITVFCNNFWFPTFLLIFCLHMCTFSTLNSPCLFYSVSFSVNSLCRYFLLLKPHIPWAFFFFKSSKQALEYPAF